VAIVADHTVQLINEIDRKINQKLNQAGEVIATRARQFVPKKTGALKESIHVEVEENVAIVMADASIIGKPMKSYAYYVEVGTSIPTPAQPYMRPALESSINDIERIFSQ